MGVESIVNVQISLQTSSPTRQEFGVVLIADANKRFTELVRSFSSTQEMLDLGFVSSDPAFIAASNMFAQAVSPPNVLVGRLEGSEVDLTIEEAGVETYTATINGVDASFTADATDTADDIASGLAAAIEGLADPTIASATAALNVVTITTATGEAYTLATSDNVIEEPIAVTGDIATQLAAFDEPANDLGGWYGLVLTSRDEADVLAAAAYVETVSRIFGTATDDADVLVSGTTTDIVSQLADLNYLRTFIIFSNSAAAEYPEAAWMGRQFTTTPGSSTWALQQLSGVGTSGITDGEAATVRNKGGNTFRRLRGVAVTQFGQMVGGEFIDIIRGRDALIDNITVAVFNRLVRAEKVPYTDQGIESIAGTLRAELRRAQDTSLIAPNTTDESGDEVPGFTVTVPRLATISSADRAARTLNEVNFTARLAGAIHTVEIQGTLTV